MLRCVPIVAQAMLVKKSPACCLRLNGLSHEPVWKAVVLHHPLPHLLAPVERPARAGTTARSIASGTLRVLKCIQTFLPLVNQLLDVLPCMKHYDQASFILQQLFLPCSSASAVSSEALCSCIMLQHACFVCLSEACCHLPSMRHMSSASNMSCMCNMGSMCAGHA